MERLLDFTDGNSDNLRELVTLYLEQTSGQVAQLDAAVGKGDAQEVRRIAHSCAGASATCGMRRIVPPLRELERLGFEEQLSLAPQLCRQVSLEFDRIRGFLEAYMAGQPELAGKR
jgi:HPt (histidine-containing phosphotransfer) domain-containing protein